MSSPPYTVTYFASMRVFQIKKVKSYCPGYDLVDMGLTSEEKPESTTKVQYLLVELYIYFSS